MRQKGFSIVVVLLAVVILLVAVPFVLLKFFGIPDYRTVGYPPTENTNGDVVTQDVGSSECDGVFPLLTPVDLSLVSGVLYPGQIRGTDYKPHGGFRFDSLSDNQVTVRAAMDGELYKGSRYLASGNVQYFLFYKNECGIMVMHDHLMNLSQKLQTLFDAMREPVEGDSRTTEFPKGVTVTRGEILAEEVGYPGNVFLDFGVYDLTTTNGVSYSESFKAAHPNVEEYGTHALCWFDLLSKGDTTRVRALPAGGIEGKVSDYCK